MPDTTDPKPAKFTGLMCISCKQPVGVIQAMPKGWIVLWCPACDHHWTGSEPGVKITVH
jgi:hypothetical protein